MTVAMAQEEAEEGANNATPAVTASGAAVEAQVRALAIVQTLGLKPEQIQVIQPLLAAAQDRRQQRTEALDALWERSRASLEAADAALVAGRQPDRRAVAAVEKALNSHRQIMDGADADFEKIGEQVLSKLDREQLGLVETIQQADARSSNLERFDGAPSLAHYLARYAIGMRALLPEEYDALRVAMGLRLAERLVAPDSRLFNQAVNDVLRIMDSVRRLSDAEFAQREAELPQAIARSLRLRDAAVDTPPVTHREFMLFVTNPETSAALAKLAPPPGAEGAAPAAPAAAQQPAVGQEEGASADTRHPLTKALDYDANLVLLADLNPTNRQLLDILTAARGTRQLVAGYEQTNQQTMIRLKPLLEQSQRALAAGQEPVANVAETLQEMQTAKEERYQKLLGSVGKQVALVRRTLAPEQARLVSWGAPAEASASTDQEAVVAELRLLASNLDQAQRLIERIRYLIVSDYTTTRIGRIEEYLRAYMRPNTPEFNETRDWLVGLIDEARVVKEEDWPAQAPVFAGQVLQRLGLLEPKTTTQAQTNYNWWDVYYLLTDVQTPEMLQAMVAARGGGG
ncbi:MAG: hypothetical protein ABFE08_05375 [Armatimonadia bacterium]